MGKLPLSACAMRSLKKHPSEVSSASYTCVEATDEDPLPMHAWATFDFALMSPGVKSTNPYDQRKGAYGKALTMNGREVFRFAVRAITEEVNSLVAEAGIDVSDIDHFVFHQANERILASAIKHLGFIRISPMYG